MIADVERRRAVNREWHTRPEPDGPCDETTATGRPCRYLGRYDGLHGRVLCTTHLRLAEDRLERERAS